MTRRRFPILLLFITTLVLTAVATAQDPAAPPPTHRPFAATPVYHIDAPFMVQAEPSAGNLTPAAGNLPSRLTPIRLTAPAFAPPGSVTTYAVALSNFELTPHSYTLTNPLPQQLEYIPDSASGGLAYEPATRVLTWQGALEPGKLEYVISDNSAALPYIDLGELGAPNLCHPFLADDQPCDNVTIAFNLGINNRSATLYGMEMREVVVSSNGLILVSNAPENNPTSPHNQWLPDNAPPGLLLAGLWRNSDMTGGGRWHAAIISGWASGHDVFYAQWHNAPHHDDPNLTARHAIAIVLNGSGELAGHIFYIYDNVSHPAQAISRGYTIGIEDRLGNRGVAWAYAPCCGDARPPQGHPPAPGTTLHLRPVLFGAANDYSRVFTYQARVNGVVPETIINTAYAASDTADPELAYVWDTHYLFVRRQLFLPLIVGAE
jgi:uncharacterized repeat protein (TIGR01451 family)